MENNEEVVLIHVPQPEPVEFRVYHDDDGRILFYSCEKLPGKYIVVDADTYVQSRPDLRVIDGKLSSVNPKAIIGKLVPGNTGVQCASEDVSIVADKTYSGPTTTWKLDVHELR